MILSYFSFICYHLKAFALLMLSFESFQHRILLVAFAHVLKALSRVRTRKVPKKKHLMWITGLANFFLLLLRTRCSISLAPRGCFGVYWLSHALFFKINFAKPRLLSERVHVTAQLIRVVAVLTLSCQCRLNFANETISWNLSASKFDGDLRQPTHAQSTN